MLSIQFKFLILVFALCSVTLLAANPASAQKKSSRAAWVGKSFDGKKCAGNHGTAGTYDYLNRARFKGMLEMVEDNHFTKGVETLTKGKTTEPIGDIDFVLSTYPNHHRALYSAMTFRLRHRNWPKTSKFAPAECYYERAMKYSPSDPVVLSQYAILAYKFKRYKQSLTLYKKALTLRPDDTLLNYNMALTLVALKRYKAAANIANEVYADGFPLPGLKNRLVAAGFYKGADTGTLAPSARAKSTQNPLKAKKSKGKVAAKATDDTTVESSGANEAAGKTPNETSKEASSEASTEEPMKPAVDEQTPKGEIEHPKEDPESAKERGDEAEDTPENLE